VRIRPAKGKVGRPPGLRILDHDGNLQTVPSEELADDYNFIRWKIAARSKDDPRYGNPLPRVQSAPPLTPELVGRIASASDELLNFFVTSWDSKTEAVFLQPRAAMPYPNFVKHIDWRLALERFYGDEGFRQKRRGRDERWALFLLSALADSTPSAVLHQIKGKASPKT